MTSIQTTPSLKFNFDEENKENVQPIKTPVQTAMVSSSKSQKHDSEYFPFSPKFSKSSPEFIKRNSPRKPLGEITVTRRKLSIDGVFVSPEKTCFKSASLFNHKHTQAYKMDPSGDH